MGRRRSAGYGRIPAADSRRRRGRLERLELADGEPAHEVQEGEQQGERQHLAEAKQDDPRDDGQEELLEAHADPPARKGLRRPSMQFGRPA